MKKENLIPVSECEDGHTYWFWLSESRAFPGTYILVKGMGAIITPSGVVYADEREFLGAQKLSAFGQRKTLAGMYRRVGSTERADTILAAALSELTPAELARYEEFQRKVQSMLHEPYSTASQDRVADEMRIRQLRKETIESFITLGITIAGCVALVIPVLLSVVYPTYKRIMLRGDLSDGDILFVSALMITAACAYSAAVSTLLGVLNVKWRAYSARRKQ